VLRPILWLRDGLCFWIRNGLKQFTRFYERFVRLRKWS